jgi:hypothetical protein
VGVIAVGVIDIHYTITNSDNPMIFSDAAIVPVVMLMASTLVLVLSQNWRWSITAFAVQYIGLFWLVALIWPIGLAGIKLVVGLMAGAVLIASHPGEEIVDASYRSLSGQLFRLMVCVLGWAVAFSAALAVQKWIPVPIPVLQGGLILFCSGLIQLGMTTVPMRVVLGLLTLLSGFEILYAGVESSTLVTGLQAVVDLGLALVGAYILISPNLQNDGDASPKEDIL